MTANTFHDAVQTQLIHHEGLKLKPYRCTAGKLTIGAGRNLDDRGITRDEAMVMLDTDIGEVVADLETFPWWAGLDEVRKKALIDMRFQLGRAGFRAFKKMLAALERGDFAEAAREARDSAWFRQVPNRAATVTRMIESG